MQNSEIFIKRFLDANSIRGLVIFIIIIIIIIIRSSSSKIMISQNDGYWVKSRIMSYWDVLFKKNVSC